MRVLAETEQIGADTAVELSRQGEVLTRAEVKVDNINENLNTAEHHIRTIKSWWGGFTNKYRKQPVTKTPVERVEGTPENTSESAHAAVSQQINQVSSSSPKMSSQPKPASGQIAPIRPLRKPNRHQPRPNECRTRETQEHGFEF